MRLFLNKPKNLKKYNLVSILDTSNGSTVVGTQWGLTIRLELQEYSAKLLSIFLL